MSRSRRPRWLIALVVIALGFIAYLAIGEFFWRNAHLVGDSEDAVMRPAPAREGVPSPPTG
mgnify:CR=1 FL=1